MRSGLDDSVQLGCSRGWRGIPAAETSWDPHGEPDLSGIGASGLTTRTPCRMMSNQKLSPVADENTALAHGPSGRVGALIPEKVKGRLRKLSLGGGHRP